MAEDWHLVHLGSRAVGGAGLIITEATAVSPEGRITSQDLGIWKDEQIEGLRRIVQFVRAQGTEIGIQLAHAGRKASTKVPWEGSGVVKPEEAWPVVAPSAIQFSEHYPKPEALTIEGIKKVIGDFRAAAGRAMLAGFKVVEIHAAHGYLVHQFLSPLSNHRTDEYGGSFENRIRLLIEIIDAVRTAWPEENPVFVRISATDWAEGGWSPEEAVRLAGLLKTQGKVDVIDCSSGGLAEHQKINPGPGYQVGFSQQIRTATGILTGAVGIITDAAQAESILVTGQADLVIMARQLLRDPYFPLNAADELGYRDMHWPVQYERAKRGKK